MLNHNNHFHVQGTRSTAVFWFTDITYDWRIRADKPLLRYLSFVFKPIFSANHR